MPPSAWTLAIAAALICSPAAAEPPVEYAAQIKPLLERHCTSCHGALRKQGGLRLDAAQFLRAGGESGEAAKPGDPAGSVLVAALKGEHGYARMPKEADRLPAEDIALVERWVAEGAIAPDSEAVAADPAAHWAFRPVEQPPVPRAPAAGNPVDAFVAAKREEAGLETAGPAPKHMLLRRLSLDLIGVPPSPEVLRAFLADDSPDAYDRAVDRLLADPRHGERWGRHWMDVWRYSDWYGYDQELRNSHKHVWRWRDWIVESLNAGKPYDRMVVEMLAADEVAPTDENALRATGFLARNYYKFNRDVWLDKTVEHTGKAFLGLTFNCAKCHDHMFDPIAQRDYYALKAIFAPHHVRTDPVSGVLDENAAGLSRIYDKNAEAVTYLFVRGNDKAPDKEHPIPPTLPGYFVPETPPLAAISLPPTAHYTGLRPDVRAALRRQSEAELAAADDAMRPFASAASVAVSVEGDGVAGAGPQGSPGRDALDAVGDIVDEKEAAGSAGASVEPTARAEQVAPPVPVAAPNPWPTPRRLAETKLHAARLERDSLEARIAADDARYATPPAAQTETLSIAAAQAERAAAGAAAEAGAVAAWSALQAARAKPEAERPKAVEEASKAIETARQALAAARTESTKADGGYTPLTEVHPATSTGRRAMLAGWITSPSNPLAARVAVNHVWARHFGKPLVVTTFDFGMHGAPPTHPELLDWLAADFIASGWDMKRLHRLMVTSQTYRLDSNISDLGLQIAESRNGNPQSQIPNPQSHDPDNRLLWRMNPRRAEGEVVRDSLLAVSGQLEERLGGPELDQTADQTTSRRSLYYRHAPEKYAPFLQTFDGANADECYRRAETVVPQQALAQVNSRLAREQSRLVAAELLSHDGERATREGEAPAEPPLRESSEPSAQASPSRLIDAAFERILCRPPSSEERAACLAFLAEQETRLADPASLSAIENGPEISVPAADSATARAFAGLVHVLLNHHDFVTIR